MLSGDDAGKGIMFTVKWIVRFEENRPIEVEPAKHADRDGLVAFCQGQITAKRISYASTPPDGFVICDERGKELRRWLAPPLKPINVIVSSRSTSRLPSRRPPRRPRPLADGPEA